MSTQEPSASAGRRRAQTSTPASSASQTSSHQEPPPPQSKAAPRSHMKRTLSSIYFGSIRGNVKPQRAKMDVNSVFGESAAQAPPEPAPAAKTKSSKKSEPKEVVEAPPVESSPVSQVPEPQVSNSSSGLTLFGKEGDTSVVEFNLGTLQEAASTQQVDLMLNVPRLPPLTKIAQIFQIAGFSDQEVWEGAPEVFSVINHFQSEIRASERFPETPIRVYMPATKEFDGVECRDYQVDKTWPISKVLRIILKKFNISSADASNYLLVSVRNHPLDPELCLADYGLGSLFRSWQAKLTTKIEIEAMQEKQKTEAADAKKAAGLKRLKTASETQEPSSKTSSTKSKVSKKSSSKSSKSSKDKEKEKSSKSSSKSKDSPPTAPASASSTDSLAALAASASQITLDAPSVVGGDGSSQADPPKLPTLDLKNISESKDKASPRESRRTKSNTGGSMRVKSPRITPGNTLAVPSSDSASGDLTNSSEGSDSVDKPSDGTDESTATTSSGHAQDSKDDKQSNKHARSVSGHSTLSKKASINSMTVGVDSTKESGESSEKSAPSDKSEKDKEKPERPKKKKSSAEPGSSKLLRPKKSTRTMNTTSGSSATDAALSSALMPTLLLDSLSLRPKTKSVPILLLLQQPDHFRGDRVKAVKWSTSMSCKKLISAFCERQGQLANSGHYVLCDLYGRALHPLANLETYGLDSKLPKWELILVHRPETREVAHLETLPLASKYAWIKNKDILPRLNMHDAKQIILELDEKLTSLQSRDIVAQYEAKSAEAENLKREVALLKETERAFTLMFGDAAKTTSTDSKGGKASIESLTEEWKNSKKVASEAMKAFESAQTENSNLMREIEAVRASRQAEIAKLTSAHTAEITQLSDYSDALFAKNTELVSEMEALHIEAFDQRQRSKHTEREKDAAKAEVEQLRIELADAKAASESVLEALKKQIDLLTGQLAHARTPRTTPAHNTEEKPIHESSAASVTEESETEVETVEPTHSSSTISLRDDSQKSPREEKSQDLETISDSEESVTEVQPESMDPETESSVDESAQSTVESPVVAPTPAPPPPPPPPPPAPSTHATSSDHQEEEDHTGVPKVKILAKALPSSEDPEGPSLQDQIDNLKAKLRPAPPRVPPKPTQRNMVMKAIQDFSKDGLRKAPPIEKHVQEPEGLAKALYKRFVAMTDSMEVETLDDDDDDDWDIPSSSAASVVGQRSLSASSIIDDDMDEDEDSDSDMDDGDDDDDASDTASLVHSRSSTTIGLDDDLSDEDSESDEE